MTKCNNCNVCGGKLQGKQSRYCSQKCKNSAHQSYNQQKKRGLKRKYELVQNSGGSCTKCGYKKNLSALSFHHTNPIEKKFKLDVRSLSNRKFSEIESELKKCILLCNNCHAEVHYPQYDLELLSSSRLL